MPHSFYRYRADQTGPPMALEWLDGTGQVIDFAAGGWTFEARIAAQNEPTTVLRTKTTGIVGATSTPNITITPALADWGALPAPAPTGDVYVLWLYATRAGVVYVYDPEVGITFELLPATST